MERNTTGNKFMKIITIPIRALSKARDMYVKSMNTYADRGCYGGAGGFGYSVSDPLPRSFSTNSVRSSSSYDGSDDLRDLIRAESSRVHANKMDLTVLNQRPHRTANNNGAGSGDVKRVPRSASVGMAKIEEDKPCEFGEDEGIRDVSSYGKKDKKKGIVLFPRSRSYAVSGFGTKRF